MTVNFGVLGAGRIGQVHGTAIAAVPGARLTAIADPVDAAAQAVRDAHGCDIRTIEQIAASDDIDAVVICTPTDTHADLIEQFARAGKAIFCEKPVDLSLARVRDCLNVVVDTGAFLMVGFQRRFEPDFNVLKAAIDDGKIGAVEMVTLTSRDPSPPPYDYIKRCGGIFRDMTIHDFDVARWLLGEEVETVIAAASVLTDSEIGRLGDFDSVNVILRTPSGKQATINNSRRATYGYDQRIEVHGSKGAVSALNHPEARVQFAGPEGYTVPPNQHFFITRYAGAYAAEIAAFVDAVSNGKPSPVTGHDGLMALALADAAVLSVAEGRAVAVADILA
ncbi:MAG: inositol 2-dehydrogenase [Rhodobacteraceae bacterium]|nr:inositol 2-dehydrogenase [Paracoccaceae bacterium]